MNNQKEKTQANINVQTEFLQRLFSHKPKKPRDTLEQMDTKIIDLEYHRTRTSLTLSDEKFILRSIDSIKRAKVQLDDFNDHERAIQDKKNEISTLRDTLRTIIASIGELESALSRVELANRLGCTTAELQTRVVECPENKLGFVIGKNGANIKQIELRTGVQVDVDKVGMKIHLHGSEAALEAAVEEVEKITLSVSDEFAISEALVDYLLAKRLEFFAKLQQDHPNVYFDFSKDKATMELRGKPDDVSEARADVESKIVVSRTKSMSQKEAGYVVGKKGETINKLTEQHSVVINVSNDDNGETATVKIIGPESKVDAALASVEDIVYQNEELEESVVVRNMQRNKLLGNSAAAIREIQGEINTGISGGGCLLVFEKRTQTKEEMNEPSKLLIRTARGNMERAKQIVQKHIDAYEADILRVDVRPDIIPALLGKGGATINALRKEGKGAEIDVDKSTGVCFIQSEDAETREAVKVAMEKIIAENQVRKVEIPKAMIGLLFGDSGKELREKITEIGSNLSVDPSDKYMILRGTEEQNDEAGVILQEFIDCNHTDEYEVSPDDQGFLFQGGNDSILRKVETGHDVRASMRKTTNILSVRGRKDNVEAALKEVKAFIEGSDNFAVRKLKVSEGLLGVIIGKGGSNISKLEEDHVGVMIQAMGDSSLLCIRGPVEEVEKCCSQIISQLATAKVTETVMITLEQHEAFEGNEILRKLSLLTGTQMTLSVQSVKIRGTSADVKDGKAFLVEHLTGVYKQGIELEPAQFVKVRSAAKDPSHFERIQSATNTEIAVDSDSSSIVVSGKRANVKKAKTFLMGFLDFLLPAEFAKVKVSKPMLKAMADPAELAKIAADSGATLSVDRDFSCILVRSSEPENVEKAIRMVNNRLKECEKLNFVERLDHSDAWLFPIIIGKGGATIQSLEKNSGCTFDISKDDLTIAISGENEDNVAKGKDALMSIIDKARKECVFIDIPEAAMAAFIGKTGSHIKQLSSDHNVEIERLRKEPNKIQIKGDEESVKAAQDAISLWISEWEEQNVGLTIDIMDSVIPFILGKGGSTITSIQTEHDVKVDVDRKSLKLSVRGGVKSGREEAMNKFRCIIGEFTAKAAEIEEAHRKAIEAARLARAAENRSERAQVGKKEQPDTTQGERRDRSKEFAAIPVGLTVIESTKKMPKKTKPKSAVVERTMPTPDSRGTQAGQSLFNMLVSDGGTPSQSEGFASSKVSPPSLVDEQWDSSTVSSGATSSGTDEEVDIFSPTEKATYKSASGFVVRV